MKHNRLRRACIGLAAMLLATPVLADDMHAAHAMPDAQRSAASQAPSTQAFQQANANMNKRMVMQYTGDPDVDFVRGMIPHHSGAVEMARVELKYGHDLEMKRFAQRIVEAQQGEIKFMQRWLNAHQKENAQR